MHLSVLFKNDFFAIQPGYFCLQMVTDTTFGKLATHKCSNIFVHPGEDFREHFDYSHICSHRIEEVGKLGTDHSPTNDDQAFG